MPPLDDQIEELDSSDSSITLDDADGEVSASSEADADSSVASTDVTEESTLSIVRDVVGTEKVETEAASSAEGNEEGQQTDETAEQAEQDDENYSDVPFRNHPRFQQLIRQKNVFKRDAELYQNVQSFMDANGLGAEEAAEGFVIMALMKTDPAAAWEKLKPHVQGLLAAAGEVLPQDLAELVNSGRMTQEAAFEVSRARAQVQSVRTNQSFQEQQAQRQREAAHVQSLRETADAWEADRRNKDPNFAAKYELIQKELAWIHRREQPATTPAGVTDQLMRAYKAVQLPAAVAPAVPRTRPTQQPSTNGQAPNARPKPQTTLDIIRAARQS